ncbi:MAG: D-2-hydroxyacid dehydrogenase [Chloroflexi bacterium]|nr:D-2-hydroxyacid dehydrogenase [Chloroflexota bacterium]
MKVIVGSTHLGERFAEQLADEFTNVQFVAAYDEAGQKRAVPDADVFLGWPPREVFLAAKKLRWIACPGMGIDRIVAVQEIVDSNVTVTNAPGPHVTPMADWVLGVILALAHRLPQAFDDQRARRWQTPAYESRIIELVGSSMGIYGLGAIGRAVAVRAATFEMKVFAVDPGPAEVPAAVTECRGLDGLDDLMRKAEWFVVTAPIKPETRHAIDGRRIRMLPAGAHVIVASRGGIVDEQALAEALAERRLGGAALDATEVEPLHASSPLWGMSNVIITPHASALSPQLYEGRRQIFRDNLRLFIAGKPLMHVCDKKAGF